MARASLWQVAAADRARADLGGSLAPLPARGCQAFFASIADIGWGYLAVALCSCRWRSSSRAATRWANALRAAYPESRVLGDPHRRRRSWSAPA